MPLIKYNAPVGNLTTFGLPASAAALAQWQTIDDLKAILADDSLPRPLKFIGGGSNLLFTKPFPGTIVICARQPFIKIEGETIIASANALLDDICARAASSGLRGIENLSAIPGTLGGAIVQNAGAYGVEIGDVIKSVNLLDLHSGQFITQTPDWFDYAYRTSRLKQQNGRYVVIDATLALLPSSAPANLAYGNLRESLGDANPSPMAVREAIINVRDSKLPDPARVGSAGSFFRNPEVDAALLLPEMPRYDLGNGLFKVPAAWLIDRAGMKGAAVGGASTWPSQPLVIVNTDGNASAADVVALENKIVSAVRERFNITLIPEVEHL